MHDGAGAVIIGHRGAAGHAPENTEAALLAGVELGADALEVDVQFTSDGTPVIFHDRTLERMAGVRGRIREQSARELAGYDVGFRFGDEYRGLRILTLDEAARLIPRGITLHLEIKEYDTVTSSHLKEVLASLKRRNLLEGCLVSSFSEKILSAIQEMEPSLTTGLLVSGKARGAAARAVHIGCSSLHPEVTHTDLALVEECHAHGLRVFSYTANDPAQMKHLLDLGVDGLYTDFPGRLREITGGRPKESRPLPPRRAPRHAAPRHHPHAKRPATATEPEGAVETWTGEPEELTPASVELPETHHPDPGPPALPGATEDEGVRKRRRRGRRGGRRHRRKTVGSDAGATAEPASLAEAVEIDPIDESAPIEIPDEAVNAEADAPGATSDPFISQAPAATGSSPPQGADAAGARKRRRRGHRGGRRHRRGGSNGPPAGGSA